MIQGRIQDSPQEGAPTLQGGPTYDFAKFREKLHEIEKILGRPPPKSATVIIVLSC